MPWDFWLILATLGVVIPWRGHVRLQRLLAQPAMGTSQRVALYGTTIAFQWILLGLVAWRAVARGLTASELGLGGRFRIGLVLLSLAGAAPFATFQWFNLRRLGGMSGPVPDFLRKLAERLLPRKPVELATYYALAITAGVCEEFLYRGFAMAALGRAGIYPWAVILLTSLLFGLALTYQGRSGVVGTTLMGIVFGVSRLSLQSLLPVMVWHATVDVVAGTAGPKYLFRPPAQDLACSGIG